MNQELEKPKMMYEKKGQAGAVGGIITLIVGVGVAVLVLIFVSVLGGQTYNLVEPTINNISDATIKTYITDSVKSGFSALKQTGQYTPLIVLAVIIFIILSLVLGFTALGGGRMGGGNMAL